MFSRRKDTEAALRVTERRVREDAAERLSNRVPALSTLEISLEEWKHTSTISSSRYVRRFVVERAPALFELPCTDKECTDGGHDLTREVMASLRSGVGRFDGEHRCDGSVGPGNCDRVLHYTVAATFRA